MRISETVSLTVKNPIFDDPSKPIREAAVADLNVTNVRAIYPVIRATHSEKLTKNFTFYPEKSLIGSMKDDSTPTGFSSFVKPFGKPIIREHRLQDDANILFGDGTLAEIPMGRVIYSAYRRRPKGEDRGEPKKGHPGCKVGEGWLEIIPAITDQVAIERILSLVYQTVSIGADAEDVWESISGVNICRAIRNDEELPPYRRGQTYDGKLSYWTVGPIAGKETSFVNNPADTLAGVYDKDIGESGIRLLLAEKRVGVKEYSFFDIKTLEEVAIDEIENYYAWDESFSLVDSLKVEKTMFFMGNSRPFLTESYEDKWNRLITEVLEKND